MALGFVITNLKGKGDKKKALIIEMEITIPRGYRTIRVLFDSGVQKNFIL